MHTCLSWPRALHAFASLAVSLVAMSVVMAGPTRPAMAQEAVIDAELCTSGRESIVDIIIVIDNSGSMSEELAAVAENINANLANILDESTLDWRVILLTEYDDGVDEFPGLELAICIEEPLSRTTCMPPPMAPVFGERFFHYSVRVGSLDSISIILDTYDTPDEFGLAPNGWSEWLRQDSWKIFVEVTDDGTGDQLDTQDPQEQTQRFIDALAALRPELLTENGERRYTFHSIIGVTDSPSDPDGIWGPEEDLVRTTCTGAVGVTYQYMSQFSRGLRFSVCRTMEYDKVFRRIANGLVGQIDLCTKDDDGDGLLNFLDNCRNASNAQQEDFDGDGKGDACDDDIDGDLIENDMDNCPFLLTVEISDLDEDGIGDACDDDIDGDGLLNEVELQGTPMDAALDSDFDGIPDFRDFDSDDDNIADRDEAVSPFDDAIPVDTDKDGTPDYLDLDSDNDTLSDRSEAGDSSLETAPFDADADGIQDFRQVSGDFGPQLIVGGDTCAQSRGTLPTPLAMLVVWGIFAVARRTRRVAHTRGT